MKEPMMMTFNSLLGVFVILFGGLAARLSAQSIEVIEPLDGLQFVRAMDISEDAQFVLGQASISVSSEPENFFIPGSPVNLRWSSAIGSAGLGGWIGSSSIRGEAISADGSTIVGHASRGGIVPFVWQAATGYVAYEGLSSLARARDISADGTTMVGESRASEFRDEPVRWQLPNTTAMRLGNLPGGNSGVAYAVSDDGSVIVGGASSANTSGSNTEAFRWENVPPAEGGGMVPLGDLPTNPFHGKALGVNADGSVIVGESGVLTGTLAFRWTEADGMVSLLDLLGGAFRSRANDVSADGSIVVGFGTTAAGQEAMIWDEINGMRNLKEVVAALGVPILGWDLREATAISADGKVIVGWGNSPSSSFQSWIIRLPGATPSIADFTIEKSVTLRFQTLAGVLYTIMKSPDGVAFTSTGVTVIGDGSVVERSFPIDAERQQYRVESSVIEE